MKNSLEIRFTEGVAGNKNQEVLMPKADAGDDKNSEVRFTKWVAGVVKNPQEVLNG